MKSKIERITDIVVEYAGPIAKYIVRAEIRKMGYTERDFPDTKLSLLVRKVVSEAIIDPDWKEMCMRRIYREVLRK